MIAKFALLTLGAVSAAVVAAVPASADPTGDAFIDSLDSAGVGAVNPTDAAALGQSVCPMLAQPGQTAADAASSVAGSAGMPLGPATMFTGLAISAFCPSAMAALSNGESPLPMSLFGLGS
jgi:hypothetical protein